MISLLLNLFAQTKILLNDFRPNTTVENIIKTPNLNMTEVWENTNKTIGDDNHLYTCLLSYVSGNCWLNSKLSNGLQLEGKDKEIYDGVNKIAKDVDPLSYPVTLFHGFEPHTNYNESTWKINGTIMIPGFLSKTPSFDVANKFSQMTSFFNRKFLVVDYPVGSRHIGINVRHPSDPEYEYLTASGENLKLRQVYRKIIFPSLCTFYICDIS